MSLESQVLIIAEAGVNHNGDIELAKQLIKAAADAGADIVKFQTFSARRLVELNAAKAPYQARVKGDKETQYEMLKQLELSVDQHKLLCDYSRTLGIRFLSSAFDIDSVDILTNLGICLFKIPSGEITNIPYLRHIGSKRGEVLLSTGMSDLDEVIAAVDVLEHSGTSKDKITVLQCTSAYPTPLNEVNLRAMQTMGEALKLSVGLSDHSEGINVALAAVALGASVIEKHITLDRNLPGPDHSTSLNPREFKALVTSIRGIELAMGDGVKQPTPTEEINRNAARKSIFAANPISRGETITEDKLTVKRPAIGLSPMLWDKVVGSVAPCDFKPDDPIRLE